MKVNHLWFPLENQDGTTFGWQYLFFPETRVSLDEFRALVKKHQGLNSNLYRDPKSRSGLINQNKLESDYHLSQHDVWDQQRVDNFTSLEEAIVAYFED